MELGCNSYKTDRPMLQQKYKEKIKLHNLSKEQH